MRKWKIFTRTVSALGLITHPKTQITHPKPDYTPPQKGPESVSSGPDYTLSASDTPIPGQTGYRPEPDYTVTHLNSLVPGLYYAVAKSLDEARLPAGALQFSQPRINHRDITLNLFLKNGTVAGKVLALGPVVETNANWHPGVALERAGSFIMVRFNLPPELCRPLTLAELRGDAIGRGNDQRPVRVVLDDTTRFALKIFGAPGAGKTTLGKLILLRLVQHHQPDGLHVYLCDPKRKLAVFRDVAHVRYLATSPADIDAVINAWCDEIDRREAASESPDDMLLLYIEEASRSLDNPDTYDRLVRTIKTCRDVGGRVIYINQTAGGDASHKELLKVITYAIVGKTASGHEAARVSGQSGSSTQKLGHGGGVFKIEQDGQMIEFVAAYLTDEDIKEASLPKKPGPKVPVVTEAGPPAEAPTEPQPVIVSTAPEPDPQASRIVLPTNADIATAIAYYRLYGKPISARTALRLKISRRRWERLTGPVNDYEQITRLLGPISSGLKYLEKKGEL